LLECKTYRFLGHYVGDPQDYRTPAEVEEHRRDDPLPRFASYLQAAGMLTVAEQRQIEKTAEEEAAEALAFAIASPEPDPAELTEHITRPFNPL